MAIDRNTALAREFEPLVVDVERGRLRAFATAIGETDPLYSDVDAAKQAGHPDLPVPPTFFFSLELDYPDPVGYLTDLGVDLRTVLHGEQGFTYHQMVHAGDTVTLSPKIVDVFSKKGGALEFLVKKTDITRDGTVVAEASTILVVRAQEAAK